MANSKKTKLALNIISRRKAMGFKSARAFAEHAKIPYGTLRDIEAGYSEGWRETREAIASALKCTIDDLNDSIVVEPAHPPKTVAEVPIEDFRAMQEALERQNRIMVDQAQLTIDLFNELRGASKSDTTAEIERLSRENLELKERVKTLPEEFWAFWLRKADKQVREVFLYLLLGEKFLPREALPKETRGAIAAIRKGLIPV